MSKDSKIWHIWDTLTFPRTPFLIMFTSFAAFAYGTYTINILDNTAFTFKLNRWRCRIDLISKWTTIIMPIMDTPPVPIGVGGQAALCLSPTHRSLYLRRAAVPKVPRQPCRHPETLRRIYVDYHFVHLSLLPPPLSRNFVIADPVKKK
jgi:hypothetical protein